MRKVTFIEEDNESMGNSEFINEKDLKDIDL